MRFEVDFHAHTHFSTCGIHSHLELLTRAKERGIRGQAITDHGPAMRGRISGTFFDRLHDPIPGITLWKGMECNLTDEAGGIDLPERLLSKMDIVLLGIHPNTPHERTAAEYTAMLIAAIDKNPAIDIITHPDSNSYPTDFESLARHALKTGVAIEINNSRVALGRCTPERMLELATVCRDIGCRIAVNTDTHAINEIGSFDAVAGIVASVGFPVDRIINATIESATQFIAARRPHKNIP